MTESIYTTTHLIDVAMEEAILGRVFVDPGVLELCRAERLEAHMFGIVRNAWIFKVMVDLDKAGDGIDPDTVANELERRDQQMEELYDGYLENLRDNHSAEIPARTYAKEIRVLHEWRELRRMCEDGKDIAEARGDGISPITAWSKLRVMADDVRPHETNQNFTFGADTMLTYRDMRSDMLEHGTAWDQPFKILDRVYGPAQPGELLGVIGPTGSGKSAVLRNVSEFYAEHKGMRTAYIFTEMRLKKVLDRRMAGRAGINYRRLKSPVELTEGEQNMMIKAEGEIMDWAHKLDYWHAQKPKPSALMATIRRLHEEFNHQVFVIDHLNDVKIKTEYGDGPDAWESFLVDLEALSIELGILAWTAAQMNRRASGERGAYMIGQAFDNKMSLSMELQPQELKNNFSFTFAGKSYDYYAGQNSPLVPVHFRKVRDGSPTRGDLLFIGERYLWTDTPTGFIRPIV